VVRVMSVGRELGLPPPWIFKISAKRCCFLFSRGKNISPLLAPYINVWKIPQVPLPPGKNPCDAPVVRFYVYCRVCLLIYI